MPSKLGDKSHERLREQRYQTRETRRQIEILSELETETGINNRRNPRRLIRRIETEAERRRLLAEIIRLRQSRVTLEHEIESEVYDQPVTAEVARLRLTGEESDGPETVAMVAELAWWRKQKKQMLKELKQRRDRVARNVTASSQPSAEQDETE